MSYKTHSYGPWTAVFDGIEWTVCYARSTPLASMVDCGERTASNALLIACAPELLEIATQVAASERQHMSSVAREDLFRLAKETVSRANEGGLAVTASRSKEVNADLLLIVKALIDVAENRGEVTFQSLVASAKEAVGYAEEAA